jgi:hypothetical protein
VKKRVVLWGTGNLEFTGVFLIVMNHNDFGSPSLSLQSYSSFSVTKTQTNNPVNPDGLAHQLLTRTGWRGSFDWITASRDCSLGAVSSG